MKFFISTILQLKRGPLLYFYKEWPVHKVEVLGLVTSVEVARNHNRFVVHDGTGEITCISWYSAAEQNLQCPPRVALGSWQRVKGKLSEFRNHIQITVDSLYEEVDPNMEVLHWLEVLQLLKKYNEPRLVNEKMLSNLQEVSNTSSTFDPVESILKSHIEEYYPTTFEFAQILENNTVRASIKTHIISTGILDPTKGQIDQQIASGIRGIVKQGYICLVDMIADTYMISSHENLGADVLNIIRKEAALSDSASLDMILLRMRENQAFRFITKEIIHEIILRLIEKNQVIEWGFKQFAPLDR